MWQAALNPTHGRYDFDLMCLVGLSLDSSTTLIRTAPFITLPSLFYGAYHLRITLVHRS